LEKIHDPCQKRFYKKVEEGNFFSCRFFPLFCFPRFLNTIFLNDLKNTIKMLSKTNRRGKTTDDRTFFPQLFWQKVFDMDFPQKAFNGVLEPPLLRNAPKRHKNPKKTYLPTSFSGYLADIRRFPHFFLQRPLEMESEHARGA
jgi:hypothetical protein